MGLENFSPAVGATIGVTGGTPIVLVGNGVTIPNGRQLVVLADDWLTRRVLTFKVKNAAINGTTGDISKGKLSASLAKPMVTAAGKTVYNVVRVELEVHPELASADAVDLRKLAAQVLVDSDLDAFWAVGSLT